MKFRFITETLYDFEKGRVLGVKFSIFRTFLKIGSSDRGGLAGVERQGPSAHRIFVRAPQTHRGPSYPQAKLGTGGQIGANEPKWGVQPACHFQNFAKNQ